MYLTTMVNIQKPGEIMNVNIFIMISLHPTRLCEKKKTLTLDAVRNFI